MGINMIKREDVETFATRRAIDTKNLLDEYQRIATQSAIYPGKGTPLGLIYAALKVNGEAGETAEHVGKAMRDDLLVTILEKMPNNKDQYLIGFNTLTQERRAALIKEIGDKLWYCTALCNELGISLSEAALLNLQKLCDRGERGKLQGSGDNR
jgi:NTP pyrophosphatase (non-canonical NTP hydrolase)